MSSHIRTKADSRAGDDADFDWYFPVFVFALRDFTLALEINGRQVTADEYMEHCLTARHGKDPNSQRYNIPRHCIRKYFKKRHCFTFDTPGGRDTLRDLEKLHDTNLSQVFVEETHTFLNFMFQEAPIKKLENGHALNGRSEYTLQSRQTNCEVLLNLVIHVHSPLVVAVKTAGTAVRQQIVTL